MVVFFFFFFETQRAVLTMFVCFFCVTYCRCAHTDFFLPVISSSMDSVSVQIYEIMVGTYERQLMVFKELSPGRKKAFIRPLASYMLTIPAEYR
jgi:hypothetical protein